MDFKSKKVKIITIIIIFLIVIIMIFSETSSETKLISYCGKETVKTIKDIGIKNIEDASLVSKINGSKCIILKADGKELMLLSKNGKLEMLKDHLEDKSLEKCYYSDSDNYKIYEYNKEDILNDVTHESASYDSVKYDTLIEDSSAKEESKELEILDTNDKAVYITPSGKKYHTETCRTIKSEKEEVNLKDINDRYEPCSICKP